MTAEELARALGKSIDAARSKARRVGLKLEKKHRGHPPAVRRRVVRMRKTGMTYAEIREATGVTDHTVRNWMEEAA